MDERKYAAKCMCQLCSQLLTQQVLLSMLMRVVNGPKHTLTYIQTDTGCIYCSGKQRSLQEEQDDAIISISPVSRIQKIQNVINLQTAARNTGATIRPLNMIL